MILYDCSSYGRSVCRSQCTGWYAGRTSLSCGRSLCSPSSTSSPWSSHSQEVYTSSKISAIPLDGTLPFLAHTHPSQLNKCVCSAHVMTALRCIVRGQHSPALVILVVQRHLILRILHLCDPADVVDASQGGCRRTKFQFFEVHLVCASDCQYSGIWRLLPNQHL